MEYKGARQGWRGGFHKSFPFYVIDIFGLETFRDYEDKFNWYIKNYMRQWRGEEVSFDKEAAIKKFRSKLSKVAVNKKYPRRDLVERYSRMIVKESMIRSVPYKTGSRFRLVLKSHLIKLFELIGLMKHFGNR
jgi:hypothetical protein